MIGSIIYKIQALTAQMNLVDSQTNKALLGNYLTQTKELRQDKIKKMEDGVYCADGKKRLETKSKEVSVQKHIQTIKKWVTSLLFNQKNTVEQQKRSHELVTKILKELDEGKTNIVKEDSALKIIEGKGSSHKALEANAFAQQAADRDQDLYQGIQADKAIHSLDKQKSSLVNKIDEINEKSFFSKIFKVISILVSIGLSVLTMGAGSPLAGFLQGGSKFIQQGLPKILNMVFSWMMKKI